MDNSLGLAEPVWQFWESNVSLHDYSQVVRWFCSVSVGWASFGRQTDIFARKIYLHNFSQLVVLSFAVCRQEDDLPSVAGWASFGSLGRCSRALL